MKNIISKIFRAVLICIFLPVASVYAQTQVNVRGTVKDAKGVPVIGAVVILEGSNSYASVTDENGQYSLRFPVKPGQNPQLTVSCLSYRTQTVDLVNRSVVDFVLQDDAQQLDEAVVVGYGSMRRSDLTGSVVSVKLDETEAGQAASFDKLLQGRAAGVQVVSSSAAPDAGVSVRIRGLNTFNGSSDPLYVVDGVIVSTGVSMDLITQGSDNSGASIETSNGLMGINPNDIASIEILKDASATAIYGSQGANGVVIITTKGATRDRPVVRANVGVDVSWAYKKMPMLSFDEFFDYMEAKNVSKSSSYWTQVFENPQERTGLKVIPMDWQDYVMRTAVSQRYYVSISGRPKNTSYMFSFSYNDTDGIVRTTGFQNYTLRLNLDKTLSPTFKIGTRTGVSYLDSHLTQGATTGRLNAAGSLMRSMIVTRPWKYHDTEAPDIDLDDMYDGGTTYLSGPDRWFTDFNDRKEEIRVNPSIYLDIKFTPWLSFRTTVGADYRATEQEKWKGSRINSTTEGSIGAMGHMDRLWWNTNNVFTINKKIKKHRINGTLGFTTTSNETTTQTVQGWTIIQYKAQNKALHSAPNASFIYGINGSTTLSYLARAVYNYSDRYILTATYRIDGSSKFSGHNKWAQFPSFAFAWRVNQEEWFDVKSISMLKLRLGWGRVGSQAISNYQSLQTYGINAWADHGETNLGQYYRALYPSNIPNPDTYDLLQSKRIAYANGISSMWVNLGSIRNRGLEFTAEATPIKSRHFEMSLGGNISFNRNKVIEIGNGAEGGDLYISPNDLKYRRYFYGSDIGFSGLCNCPINLFVEGQPIGIFYGLITDGIVQEGSTGIPYGEAGEPSKPGSINWVDVNGDGFISELDRVKIGDPNPDFTYGFHVNFQYRRWNLNLNFVGSYGNDIYNVNEMLNTRVWATSNNITRDAFYKAWTPENTNTRYPALNALASTDYYYASDLFVEDGSYLRIANITLGYNLPLKGKGFVKGIALAATVSNPWFWTRYSGYDPDVNSYQSIYRMGADMGSYPGARAMKFDVKFTF